LKEAEEADHEIHPAEPAGRGRVGVPGGKNDDGGEAKKTQEPVPQSGTGHCIRKRARYDGTSLWLSGKTMV
jgi:hypothetical protein